MISKVERKKLTKTANVVSVILFKSTLNILKSVIFNVFVFCIGIGVGYCSLGAKMHYYATTHSDYQYAEMIEKRIRHLKEMDQEYTATQQVILEILKQLKQKMAHEQHHECDTALGAILFK